MTAPTPMPQQQPYWPGTAGPDGYVSPIPVREATLGDAVKAEWTKIRSLRSTMWTLGVMLVVVIGVGTLVAVVLAARASGTADRTSSALDLGFIGVLLGMLPVLTLGVLTLSSEYGTGLIRTTLTACPSRTRVLAAKAIVYFALTFVTTLVANTLVALIDQAALGGHTDYRDTAMDWLRATAGVSLYLSLLGLLALGIGGMLRHSAGAISTVLGLVLLPLILAMFLGSFRSLAAKLVEYSVPAQLSGFYPAANGPGGPGAGISLLIAAVLTAASLAGAHALMSRRDA
ncbi:ABC transporter permease [Streptomyces orinoci]|uniref:ABC transporter permease n=1 Tax=Streptomyces orinoci TaxID=67339 RepID=A0ABV3JTE7_STRON|nr:ABC transporter permease [Streptomyces orinoci]